MCTLKSENVLRTAETLCGQKYVDSIGLGLVPTDALVSEWDQIPETRRVEAVKAEINAHGFGKNDNKGLAFGCPHTFGRVLCAYIIYGMSDDVRMAVLCICRCAITQTLC